MDELIKNIKNEKENIENMSSKEKQESFISEEEDVHFNKYNDTEIKILTNFNILEVKKLYVLLGEEFSKLRSLRGRKSKISNLDKLFMLLIYLKTYKNFRHMAILFKIKPSNVQKYIKFMITNFSKKLYEIFVESLLKDKFPTSALFPDVEIIIDCSVQQIGRFSGSFNDTKLFFFGKHHIYCVKKEFVYRLDGKLINVSNYRPGSHHDFSLFLSRVAFYKKILKKEDENEYFSIMADKGYEGIQKFFPSIVPLKGNNLSAENLRINRRIGSVRVIAERYYGRMKYLFASAKDKVRNDLSLYDDIMKIIVALTNFHIDLKPLTRNDESNLKKIMHVSKEKDNMSLTTSQQYSVDNN